MANLGQRSRLPPPGFPSSSPNHMNSFGLGIPRPAPSNNTLSGEINYVTFSLLCTKVNIKLIIFLISDLLMSTGNKILPFASHSSGVLLAGQTSHQTTYLPNQNSLLNSQGNLQNLL